MAASNGVFLKVGESLVLLEPQPYASEDVLQKALEQYPEVLAGPTTTNDEPTRLALVKREQPISDTPDGAGRWSLDHLFVDSHAVPVLVEVKRSSDTRIRREVIGQMLEYAANALRHWRTDSLREAFRTTCQAADQDEEAMLDALGSDQPVASTRRIGRPLSATISYGSMSAMYAA